MGVEERGGIKGRRRKKARKNMKEDEGEEVLLLHHSQRQTLSVASDRAEEALDVKWRRQFPLPLAPTGE